MLLTATKLSAGALLLAGAPAAGLQEQPKKRPTIDPKRVPDKGPRLDTSAVFEFVYFAHTDHQVVKDMLAEQPALINAAWDWGGGDWETGLGAASHMGRRDIAETLLKANARLDLFAATMLGKLEIVKASLTAFPDALRTPGPHGIPLIKHAEKGGEDAKAVLEYLRSLTPVPGGK
jgi:hypothetical protein